MSDEPLTSNLLVEIIARHEHDRRFQDTFMGQRTHQMQADRGWLLTEIERQAAKLAEWYAAEAKWGDEIFQLRGKVERLTAELAEKEASRVVAWKDAERYEAERDRLAAELKDANNHAARMLSKQCRLATENDRLRAALERIASLDADKYPLTHLVGSDIAGEALAGAADETNDVETPNKRDCPYRA